MKKSLSPILFFLIFFLHSFSVAQDLHKNISRFMAWDNSHSFSENLSDEEIEAYLEKLNSHNIKGIFLAANEKVYKRVIPVANKVGVEIHAWHKTMIRPDEQLMKEHKDWYAVNKNGESCVDNPPYVGYYRWLCPNKPEVIDYLVNDYMELAQIDGLKGIHLDYIRYCDIFLPKGLWKNYNLVQDHEMPEYDYCYCKRCRDGFKNDFGIDPLDIKDSLMQKNWKEWRLKSIVNVANTISRKVKEKTGKIVTAAVFPTPKMSANMVRQDWSKFELDAVCPMLYNDFYEKDINWIGECVKESIETMEYKKELYAGLMVNNINAPNDFKNAIKTAIDNGASRVVFFSARNLTEEHFRILKQF